MPKGKRYAIEMKKVNGTWVEMDSFATLEQATDELKKWKEIHTVMFRLQDRTTDKTIG